MKTLLTLLTFLGTATLALAQNVDTTAVQPQQTEVIEQKVEPVQSSDTLKVEESPVQQVITEEPQNPVVSEPEAENEPKIIYYQSTPEREYQSQRNYSYRSRRSRNDIKTLAGNMNHSGGFGAISFRTTEFNNEAMVIAGVRAGWIINRTVGIGFEGHGIIPTTKYEGIDITQDVFAVGGYGGMFLELIFFSNSVVHVTFPTSAGAGWIGYNEDWENPNPRPPGNSEYSSIIDEDIFWYVEPGANLEVNIARNFRMDFGVSKRFTQDFELLNTDENGFENINFYVTLKIGGF